MHEKHLHTCPRQQVYGPGRVRVSFSGTCEGRECSTSSNGRLRLPAPPLLIFGFLDPGSSGVSKKNLRSSSCEGGIMNVFVRALSCNSEHALTLAEVNVHMKTH